MEKIFFIEDNQCYIFLQFVNSQKNYHFFEKQKRKGWSMDQKNHWENVYEKKQIDEVSWHQAHPKLSLQMIQKAKLPLEAVLIDIGAGASKLVDDLIELGYNDLSVLDISGKALEHAKQRLGDKSKNVQWIESDILKFNSQKTYSFWHDRAVFHFITNPEDRQQYLNTMNRSLSPASFVMIATFALDGPEKCSNLPVHRYSHESLQETLGCDYRLIAKDQEIHVTPAGKSQSFIYGLFRKEG